MNEPPSADNQHLLPAHRQSASAANRMPSRAASSTAWGGNQQRGLTPALVLWVFRQRWQIVVPVGLVLAASVAAIVLYSYVPKFEAKALVMIEETAPFIAFSGQGGARNSARYTQTQIELLRSPLVLRPVLSRPEIASLTEFSEQVNPEGHLSENLTIQQVGRSVLYNIQYVSHSAQAAAAVVNAIAAEYLEIQSVEEFYQSQRVIDILEEERLRRSVEVERLRKHVVALAEEVTGTDPFANNKMTNIGVAVSPTTSLFHSLTEADVAREVLRAEIQASREAPVLFPDQADASGQLDLEIETRADVLKWQAELAMIQTQMDNVKRGDMFHKSSDNWSTDPEYLRLKDDLIKGDKELAELKSKLRVELQHQRMEARKFQHEQSIAANEKALAKLDIRRQLLSDRFDDGVKSLKEGSGKSVQLEFARAELAREEGVFELIAARKLALQTELRAPARVRLRQAASIPTIPIESVPYKILLISCLAALISPLALATALEMSVNRISDAEQLSQESNLRVLGEVTRFPVRPVASGPRTLSSRTQRDLLIFAESIDSLRTNLVLSGNLESNNVIAVSSAATGEGKTNIVISLAASIAGATKEPTLVLDADMRSPDVADVLGTPAFPGLAEVLAKKCTLEDAIHQRGETNTYVLPSGHIKTNPHHLVQGLSIDELLNGLREKFPYIVIDTPPILGASEALVFAKAADTVLYCSLCDVSRSRQVRVAIERLENAGANVVGAILSGTPVSRYSYVYGYYSDQTS